MFLPRESKIFLTVLKNNYALWYSKPEKTHFKKSDIYLYMWWDNKPFFSLFFFLQSVFLTRREISTLCIPRQVNPQSWDSWTTPQRGRQMLSWFLVVFIQTFIQQILKEHFSRIESTPRHVHSFIHSHRGGNTEVATVRWGGTRYPVLSSRPPTRKIIISITWRRHEPHLEQKKQSLWDTYCLGLFLCVYNFFLLLLIHRR